MFQAQQLDQNCKSVTPKNNHGTKDVLFCENWIYKQTRCILSAQKLAIRLTGEMEAARRGRQTILARVKSWRLRFTSDMGTLRIEVFRI